MKWFRSHHGAPTDSKWLVCARRSGQPPALVAVVWWCLMDYASKQEDRGSIEGFDAEEIAAFFQTEQTAIEAVLGALQEKRCTTGKRIAKWEEYQPDETSTPRVRAHRERQGTAPKRPETVSPDPETKGNEISSLSRSSSGSALQVKKDFEGWYARYPRKCARGQALKAYAAARKKTSAETLLAGIERYETLKPAYADWAQPATWLNGERWRDEPDAKGTLGQAGTNGHASADPDRELEIKVRAMAKGGPRLVSVTDRELAQAVAKGWLPSEKVEGWIGPALLEKLIGEVTHPHPTERR